MNSNFESLKMSYYPFLSSIIFASSSVLLFLGTHSKTHSTKRNNFIKCLMFILFLVLEQNSFAIKFSTKREPNSNELFPFMCVLNVIYTIYIYNCDALRMCNVYDKSICTLSSVFLIAVFHLTNTMSYECSYFKLGSDMFVHVIYTYICIYYICTYMFIYEKD